MEDRIREYHCEITLLRIYNIYKHLLAAFTNKFFITKIVWAQNVMQYFSVFSAYVLNFLTVSY